MRQYRDMLEQQELDLAMDRAQSRLHASLCPHCGTDFGLYRRELEDIPAAYFPHHYYIDPGDPTGIWTPCGECRRWQRGIPASFIGADHAFRNDLSR